MAKPLYRGTYQRRAKAIRDAAYANPDTRCWRCGRTYTEAVKLWTPEMGRRRAEDAAAWQAGHRVDGHAGSPLSPEHARCNAAAGGRLKHTKASAAQNPASPNA